MQCAQKNCKNGISFTESLNKEVMKDLLILQPARKISINSDPALKTLEQDSFDIEHKVHVQECLKHAQQPEENKTKACALVFGNHCNQTM